MPVFAEFPEQICDEPQVFLLSPTSISLLSQVMHTEVVLFCFLVR